MHLLNPAALGFAVIIPLIILMYLLKPRYQEMTVSSTYLWEQVLKDMEVNTPWQKLQKNLLLFLQLLAAALLIFALCRPFLPGDAHAGKNLIVVLDCSASMKACDVSPSRFAEAQSQIENLIDKLGPDERMTLIAMAEQPRVLLSASRDQLRLRHALNSAQAGWGRAALEPALSLIAALAEKSPHSRVFIFSDGRTLPVVNDYNISCPLEFRPIGREADNLAIAALATRRQADRIIALARVHNYGDEKVQSDLELLTDTDLIDARQIEIAGGADVEVIWDQLPADIKTIEARISRSDFLPADNHAFAVVERVAERRVLLVSEGNIFLEKALQLLPGVKLSKTLPRNYIPEMSDYQLYIFDGFLPARIPRASLMVLNPPGNNILLEINGEINNVAQIIPPANDPLLQYVDVNGWQLARCRRMALPAWGRSLLECNGLPLIIAGQADQKRVVFGFDLHDSNIPLQTGFPILINNLANWLLPANMEFNYDASKGTLQVDNTTGLTEIRLQAPGEKEISYLPPFPRFLAAEKPGLYRITQMSGDQQEINFLPVNPGDMLESNIRPGELSWPGKPKQPEKAAINAGQEEIWPFLIWGVLGLLLAEWEVYRRGY